MKKRILFIMGMVCVSAGGYAQFLPGPEPLRIGDTVPDIVFHHMLNYKDSTARLSDFAGKPIILDFFATWCGSCIAALPKLDSLQKKFSDSIQILVVDYESTEKVAKFLKNNPTGKSISLPFITRDSILSKFFPHRLIPHEVFMGINRRVAGITYAEYVTLKNLRNLIAGQTLHFPLKQDVMAFDASKPLFLDNNGGSLSDLAFRSTFSRYLKGIGGSIGVRKDSIHIRWVGINMPILWLYSEAWDGFGNRLILNVKDSSRYFYAGREIWNDWAKKNCYCYEMIAPLSLPQEKFHAFMLQDLNRYLGLNGHKEQRVVPCWALINKEDNVFLFQTNGEKSKVKYGKDDNVKTFHNIPVSRLIRILNHQIPGKPLVPIIINETHYSGNIDLKLRVDDIHNISALRKALQPYGLDLIRVKRKLEMFVLTDKDFRDSTY